jgi:microcystin degradation protein MlrC
VRSAACEARVAEVTPRAEKADEGLAMRETPLAFLAERGLTLDFHVTDGFTWADLRSLADPSFVIHRYSRAGDTHAAAQLAAERWRSEQRR